MRNIDAAILAALEAEELLPFLLFELTVDTVGYYFTDCDVALVYGGHRYEPRRFEFSDVRYSSATVVDQVTIKIDDLDNLLTGPFITGTPQGEAAVLSQVILDPADFSIVGDARVVYFAGTIDSWGLAADSAKTITLTNKLAQWNRMTGNLHPSSCRYKQFKEAPCNYAGDALECDRSYTRCQELGNTANYGGFRWLPDLETKELWWGREQGKE